MSPLSQQRFPATKGEFEMKTLSMALLSVTAGLALIFTCEAAQNDKKSARSEFAQTLDDDVANQTDDVAAIMKLNEDWRSGWHAGDVDLLLSLYGDAPVLLPEGQAAVVGKEAIRPLYSSVLKEVDVRGQGAVMKVEVSGDLGYFWSN